MNFFTKWLDEKKQMTKPSLAILRRNVCLLAFSLLWLPYIYGGQHPWLGLDCSGLWVEIARLLGLYRKNEDYNVEGLWKKYEKQRLNTPEMGCLAFYGNKANPYPTHVTICVDEYFCISASGGGSEIKEKTLGAMITFKKINYRNDIWGFLDPFGIVNDSNEDIWK